MREEAREARVPLVEAPGPGEVRMLDVGRHRVGLFRVGEELYALADRCPHRGGPICSAGEVVTAIELRDGVVGLGPESALVRCPWHKWDFEIATGRCTVDPRLRVKRYDVRTEDGEVVVSL